MCVLICKLVKFCVWFPLFQFGIFAQMKHNELWLFFLNCKKIAMRFNLEKLCLPNQILATEKRNTLTRKWRKKPRSNSSVGLWAVETSCTLCDGRMLVRRKWLIYTHRMCGTQWIHSKWVSRMFVVILVLYQSIDLKYNVQFSLLQWIISSWSLIFADNFFLLSTKS